MGCHPSHWLIFFKMVKPTNQVKLIKLVTKPGTLVYKPFPSAWLNPCEWYVLCMFSYNWRTMPNAQAANWPFLAGHPIMQWPSKQTLMCIESWRNMCYQLVLTLFQFGNVCPICLAFDSHVWHTARQFYMKWRSVLELVFVTQVFHCSVRVLESRG
jgi:hypothetical protein